MTAMPDLDQAVAAASAALLRHQKPDGHWVFELEADATIPAEYVLLVHYLAEEPNLELEKKIGVYLRRIQGKHDGWPLFHDGDFDMSASVKAYFALKMIGDDIDAPHMKRAREAIRSRGGAEESNVFTRVLLSLFGVTTWRAVPVMPVEIMLLPKWFPFHLSKVSYWARTVIAPLLVLQALKPKARNPKGVGIDELFLQPPLTVGPKTKAPHQKWSWFLFFRGVDAILRLIEPHFPKGLRQRAIDKAVEFVTERLNGEDGLGAIFPAMANSVMMYDVLEYPRQHPDYVIARKSIDKLLVVHDDEAYCQPCVSPVWDTALVAHALLETKDAKAEAAVARGLEWLKPLQVLDVKGDWAEEKPDVRPGGWAFQYRNDYYPDLDDTAVVVMAMDRAQQRDQARHHCAVGRVAAVDAQAAPAARQAAGQQRIQPPRQVGVLPVEGPDRQRHPIHRAAGPTGLTMQRLGAPRSEPAVSLQHWRPWPAPSPSTWAAPQPWWPSSPPTAARRNCWSCTPTAVRIQP